MARKADDDDELVHFQSSRFVQQNGEWFYVTRDGEERGPFVDKADAEGDLILYMRECYNSDK